MAPFIARRGRVSGWEIQQQQHQQHQQQKVKVSSLFFGGIGGAGPHGGRHSESVKFIFWGHGGLCRTGGAAQGTCQV